MSNTPGSSSTEETEPLLNGNVEAGYRTSSPDLIKDALAVAALRQGEGEFIAVSGILQSCGL